MAMNRPYSRYDRQAQVQVATAPDSGVAGSRVDFLKQVYALFGGSLLVGALGAFVGQSFAFAWEHPFLMLLLELGALFAVFKTRHNAQWASFALFGFAFISGLTIAPLVGVYAARSAAPVVTQALVLSGAVFGGLSLYALTTRKDFSFLQGFLFAGLIVLIVAGLSNFFFQSTVLQLAIASVGVLLFSGFILFDTQQIARVYPDNEVTMAALALYLDFLNLFISLLQLLGFLNNEE
ncbi:MAG: BAX inhibitor (BI)-1/YccA family protein [Alphaproteobacteria bacterium CG_4_10_14_0_2_um_filter_63_37]|nr:MAG: hypothetical protein AUJ55_06555 [Proteobacteria bacterium CG1_02_64_396]PJA26087.1 MAG: BAX inhibitor (BI)-1/YccA family protein [Alphaproteobacteria bacterium CG_4_10_14_0_2_um_filter_63_37]